MNVATLLSLIATLLPTIEQGIALAVHSTAGQNKLALIFGEVNTVAAVSTAIAAGLHPSAPVAA